MATSKQFQQALQHPYDKLLFAKEVLHPIFGKSFSLLENSAKPEVEPNSAEKSVIKDVRIYGNIELVDGTEILCYEIILQPTVRIEQSKVAIQQYVRKLLFTGQAALINFIAPENKDIWRFTLVAKDTELTETGIKETQTHPHRYTYLVERDRPNRTMSDRLETLSLTPEISLALLVEAFSVEAMSKAFFDEYKEHYQNFVEYLTGKRMVKVKGKWEEKITGNASPFLKSTFNGNEKDARDFIKKLMGRIVFLYFVQKKRWMGASTIEYKDGDYEFIYHLFKETGGNENFFPLGLSELFFNALNAERKDDDWTTPLGNTVKIPYLNGGLFVRDDTDERIYAKGNMLTFPPSLFSHIEKKDTPKDRGFLDFLNAYNFTVYEDSEDDHVVAVDPEMLGHIFENLLEDNKDKGAYYTPKEIVHFMCQESLIEYLSTQSGIDRAILEPLVKEKELKGVKADHLEIVDSLLDNVKVCDPAIGSGAFPMGVLQEIFTLKEIIAFHQNIPFDAAGTKESIISNSIYGVDIERGAVDIARLRFWLSLVVDEEQPKALPNLDYKIVVGNSLLSKFGNEVIKIDWDIVEGTQFDIFGDQQVQQRQYLLNEISKKQRLFFDPENKDDKRALKQHIRNLKIDLLINQLELMCNTKGLTDAPQRNVSESANAFKNRTEQYLTTVGWIRTIDELKKLKTQPDKPFDHFDWKLDFPEILNPIVTGEAGGFDIVIGNPPYVQLQKMGDEATILQDAGYETYIRTGDIYCLFYELGHRILKDNGVLTFITSNKWMRAAYGEKLRRFFIDQCNPLKLIDFSGYQVFENVTVDVNILISNKSNYSGSVQTCSFGKSQIHLNYLSDYFRQNKTITTSLKPESAWVIMSGIELEIKQKIERRAIALKNWNVRINYGIKTGFNEAFIIDTPTKEKLIEKSPISAEIIRPIIRGRDISKYNINFSDLWLINTHNGNKSNNVPPIDVAKDYPIIFEHLKQYENQLKKRSDKGDPLD